MARPELKRAGQVSATKEWLEPQLDSSQGTKKVQFGSFACEFHVTLWCFMGFKLMHRLHVMQMYSLLEHHIEQPEFLKKLEKARDASRTSSPKEHGDEVLHEEWWEEPPHDSNSAPALSEEFTEVTNAL